MGRSGIRASDVRSLLRLQGEVAEIDGAQERSEHLVDSLCRIVGADGGGVAHSVDFRPGGMGRLARHFSSGFAAADDRRVVIDELAVTTARDPAIAQLMHRQRGDVLTLRRCDLATDREWYRSGYVNQISRVAGIDDVLYSSIPGPGRATVYGLALYRQWGRRPFTTAERDVIDLFQQEALSVHRSILEEDRAASPEVRLTPRLAATLRDLLAGFSEKEIAARMSVTVSTLHGYVKEVYRRHQVNSRPQLMALFLGGRPRRP